MAGAVSFPILKWGRGSLRKRKWLAEGHTASKEWSFWESHSFPENIVYSPGRTKAADQEHKLRARETPWKISQHRDEHFLPAPELGSHTVSWKWLRSFTQLPTSPSKDPTDLLFTEHVCPTPNPGSFSVHRVLKFNCSQFLQKTNRTSRNIPSLAECLFSDTQDQTPSRTAQGSEEPKSFMS